jgi:hypothetical protein
VDASKTGTIKLGVTASKWDCLDRCRTINSRACEWSIQPGECRAHTEKVEEANEDETSLCYILGPRKADKGIKTHDKNLAKEMFQK